MVMDKEAGVKEKCLALLEEVMLEGLACDQAQEREYAWTLLDIVADDDRLDLRFVSEWCAVHTRQTYFCW